MSKANQRALLLKFLKMDKSNPQYKPTLDRLVESLDYMVHKTLENCFYDKSVDPQDLLQNGRIALMEALQHFDPKAGTQFSTYTITAIKNGILDGIKEQCPSKVAYSNEQAIRKVTRKHSEQYNSGSKITHEELAKEMGISEEQLLQKLVSCRRNRPAYLNQRYTTESGDGETDVLAELIPGEADCHDMFLAEQRHKAVLRASSTMGSTLKNIMLCLMVGYKPRVVAKMVRVPISVIPEYITQAQQILYKKLEEDGSCYLFPELEQTVMGKKVAPEPVP